MGELLSIYPRFREPEEILIAEKFPFTPSEQALLCSDSGSSATITHPDYGRLHSDRYQFFEQDNRTPTPQTVVGGANFPANRTSINIRGRGGPTLSSLIKKPEKEKYRGLDHKIINTLKVILKRMQQTRGDVRRSGDAHPTPPQPIIIGIGQDTRSFPKMIADIEIILSGSEFSNADKNTIRRIAGQKNPEESIEAYLKKAEQDTNRGGARRNPICLTDEMECEGTNGDVVMNHPANDSDDIGYANDNNRGLFGHVEMNRHRSILGHPDNKNRRSNQPADSLPGVIVSEGSHDFDMEDGSVPSAQETAGAKRMSTKHKNALKLNESQARMDRPAPSEKETNIIPYGSQDGDYQRPSWSALPNIWRAVSSTSHGRSSGERRHEQRRPERRRLESSRERSPANFELSDDRNTRKALRVSRYENLGL